MRPESEVAFRRGPSVWFLFRPALQSARNRLRSADRGDGFRLLQMLLFGGALWLLVAGGAERVLSTFGRHPEIAEALTRKVLSVAIAAGFALAVVTTTIASLGIFYQGKNLALYLAAPIDWLQHYLDRMVRTLVHGGWALVLAFSSVLVALGWQQGFTPAFVVTLAVGGLALLATATAVGNALALLLARIGSVDRIRVWLTVGGAALVGGLLLYLRAAAPERLFSPDELQSSLAILEMLNAPTFPWLPSEWWADALVSSQVRPDWWALGAVVGSALASVTGAAILFGSWYRTTLVRARTGRSPTGGRGWFRQRARRAGARLQDTLESIFGPGPAQMVLKDLRRLGRDTAGWSHAILVGFSLVVYFYNLRLLPTGGEDEIAMMMTRSLVLLSLGVGSLVLAAVAGHFVLPTVSLESPGLWLLRSGPVRLRDLVRVKFRLGALLLVPVGMAVSVTSTALLGGERALLSLSAATGASVSVCVIALALWFGARYPVFQAASPAEIASSAGAALFTFAAMGLAVGVVALEAPLVLSALEASGQGLELASAGGEIGLYELGTTLVALLAPLLLAWVVVRATPSTLERQILADGGG